MSLKLLLDQNLSRKLVGLIEEYFPGSVHVLDAGLQNATDREIWEYARLNGFAIVSKDSDFHHMSFLHGPPPKAVWVKLGNCTTGQIRDCLAGNVERLHAFMDDGEAALLVLEG